MSRFRSLLAVVVLAALFALAVAVPAAAQDHGPAPTGGEGDTGSEHDVVPVLVWSAVGIVAGGIVLSGLYLFKRRIGGFPANPSWVAPITIMPSKDFPTEGSYGDVPAGGHH
ncbi:MAG: hypothetical protein IT302_13180 [Dehalococcoidia bacterium]|nr:hypothetical protein [Dehalococcoidia bacterium]